MALPRRCLSAALLLFQVQGQAVLETTCEQVATYPWSCYSRGLDMDECGEIFVSTGCDLWAVDRRNFSEPRLVSSTRRRGYGKVIARREDLLTSLRGKNKVVALDKELVNGDTDDDATVLIDPVDDPIGIALTPDNHLLVAESDDYIITKWTLQGSRVSILAGNGERSENRTAGSIGLPYGLAVSSTGRVCSTDRWYEQLFCFPSDDSDTPTDELQLVKNGFPDDPYHIFFDADDNLWLSDHDGLGRLWVFLANGTEVLLEFSNSTGSYGPIAMVVDTMDDSRFFLLGMVEEVGNALFLCSNPLSSGRTTPECTTTTTTLSTSTLSTSTTSASSTSTSSTTNSSTASSSTLSSSTVSSSTLSSTTSATDTETSTPSTTTTGTTTDTATGTASTTTGTTSPAVAETSTPALQGPSTLPSSPTSATADGSSTAALVGATSSGQSPGASTATPAAPAGTFAAGDAPSTSAAATSMGLQLSAAPTETSAAPAETSAAGSAPSTRAAATPASPGLQPSAAPTETSPAPTKTSGDVPSTPPTTTLTHTTLPSETAAARGSSAPAITAPIVRTASSTFPASIMVEAESSSKGLAPSPVLLILMAAYAAM